MATARVAATPKTINKNFIEQNKKLHTTLIPNGNFQIQNTDY
jgi:hypothetical protein